MRAEDYPVIEGRYRYPAQRGASRRPGDDELADERMDFKSLRREIRKRSLRQKPSMMR
ncbi:hypothetical protein [Asticcacaulis sp. AC402]|uniref:hypothetical protein n=1 Tax=Asticcacaulis sp. AC402 TaxID=1282361 RepID=UPI0012DF976B|nr:hypothetical protein [Asticcacaulis sp. AC402]